RLESSVDSDKLDLSFEDIRSARSGSRGAVLRPGASGTLRYDFNDSQLDRATFDLESYPAERLLRLMTVVTPQLPGLDVLQSIIGAGATVTAQGAVEDEEIE